MDSNVRDCAAIIEDTELLGRLSAGDMVAQDAKYHKNCLSVLHNRVRKAEFEGPEYKAKEREVSGTVFSELVLYIEEAIVELYQSIIHLIGVKLETKVHYTRLKQRLLAQFTDMRAHTKGRGRLLLFEEDVQAAPTKALSWTAIMMWSILHVLHRPCAAIFLKKVNTLTDYQKDTKKIMCHHCYLPL